MLNFENTDIAFIKKYMENPDEILENSSLEDVLEKIDVFILVNGFDDNYDLTDIGREAQRTYDNVYKNNKGLD